MCIRYKRLGETWWVGIEKQTSWRLRCKWKWTKGRCDRPAADISIIDGWVKKASRLARSWETKTFIGNKRSWETNSSWLVPRDHWSRTCSVYPGYILHPESIPKILISSERSARQQFKTCSVYPGYIWHSVSSPKFLICTMERPRTCREYPRYLIHLVASSQVQSSKDEEICSVLRGQENIQDRKRYRGRGTEQTKRSSQENGQDRRK